MACRLWIVGAALLLLVVLFDSMGSAQGLSLKELMLKDEAEKKKAASGSVSRVTGKPKPTSKPANKPTNRSPTQKPRNHNAPKATPVPKGGKEKNVAATKATATKGKSAKAGAAGKKKAAPGYAQHQAAQPLQAPMMQGGGSSSAGHGAALGTSALIGIGVGVGVACLVAVGAVVGLLVHLRRRKRKGAQLEKQKTYGGTE